MRKCEVNDEAKEAKRRDNANCRPQWFGTTEPVSKTNAEENDEKEINCLFSIAALYESAACLSGMEDVVDDICMDLHPHEVSVVEGCVTQIADGNGGGAKHH